jgi:hypothetical protein
MMTSIEMFNNYAIHKTVKTNTSFKKNYQVQYYENHKFND